MLWGQPLQKWNTYGKLPASGPGSTVAAARNFVSGLENIVNFIKVTLNKEKISILGKTEIGLRCSVVILELFKIRPVVI